jgi:hypothetical protein
MSTTNAEPTAQIRPATDRGYFVLEGNRLVFDFTDESVEFLNRIMRDTGDSPELMFRKALGLYRMMLDAQQEGKFVGVVSDPEVLENEFVNE